jgi:hypothetical protein
MYKTKKIALRYKRNSYKNDTDDNSFVALDSNSGGYPYRVSIHECHDFQTLKHAKEYPDSAGEFEIIEVEVQASFRVLK